MFSFLFSIFFFDSLPKPPRIRSSLPPLFCELFQLTLESFLLLLNLLDLRVAILHKYHPSLRPAHRVHGHRPVFRDLILNLADFLIARRHLLPYVIRSAAPIRFLTSRRALRAPATTAAAALHIPGIGSPAASATPVAH